MSFARRGLSSRTRHLLAARDQHERPGNARVGVTPASRPFLELLDTQATTCERRHHISEPPEPFTAHWRCRTRLPSSAPRRSRSGWSIPSAWPC